MNLGNRLFHARKKCGLSQEDMMDVNEIQEAIGNTSEELKSTGQAPGGRNIRFCSTIRRR